MSSYRDLRSVRLDLDQALIHLDTVVYTHKPWFLQILLFMAQAENAIHRDSITHLN